VTLNIVTLKHSNFKHSNFKQIKIFKYIYIKTRHKGVDQNNYGGTDSDRSSRL
jgi:hypothetical protein